MKPDFTDIEARQAKPKSKTYRLAIGNGFCLQINPDGTKYWRLRYRYGGKEQMLSLGVYPLVTLQKAFDESVKARRLLLDGINPTEAKRQQKHNLRLTVARTFGDAAEKWFLHNSIRWKIATQEKVRQYLDKDLLPLLGHRPLANITPLELGLVIERIEARKALNVAKKVRQWLDAIFTFAIAKGLTNENPAQHLGSIAIPQAHVKNHAHIDLAELPGFLKALDAYEGSHIVKQCTLLSLWTANRPGVTRTLKWSEIDLKAGLWTIPKGREGMKRGYQHITTLPTQAVKMLEELHKVTGKFEYVFVGRNDWRKPMSDGAVGVLLKAIGYGGKQTAHGFRHLISTALNEKGYEADWVEKQLAHGDPDLIRGTYNKAAYVEQRKKMMQDWADYLDQLRKDSPKGKKTAGKVLKH